MILELTPQEVGDLRELLDEGGAAVACDIANFGAKERERLYRSGQAIREKIARAEFCAQNKLDGMWEVGAR